MLKVNNKSFYFPLFSLFKGQNVNPFFLLLLRGMPPFSISPNYRGNAVHFFLLPPFRGKCRQAKGVIFSLSGKCLTLHCRHSNADLHFYISFPPRTGRLGGVKLLPNIAMPTYNTFSLSLFAPFQGKMRFAFFFCPF